MIAQLNGISIAISISESPDMATLGFGPEHLDDAMTEVARHLLAAGARIFYGGDLRAEGFTQLLFEIVARHRPLGQATGPSVVNFLPWPVHAGMDTASLEKLLSALDGAGEMVLLDVEGRPLPAAERVVMAPATIGPADWEAGLTAMRRATTLRTDARVALGGKIAGFKGRMPGVVEEVLLATEHGQPVYLLGGFGGAARDVAADLGFVDDDGTGGPKTMPHPRVDFAPNGLTHQENATLARTAHIDEAVALLLRGLSRLMADGSLPRARSAEDLP